MNMPRLFVVMFSIILTIGVIPAAKAALFSIAFYEVTGNINDADPGPGLNNFFDDYTYVGGGTFEIADRGVEPNSLVAFSSEFFINFSISLDGLSTGDSSTFTLGVDDFELGEPNERGLLFDEFGAPLQFRVVGSGTDGSRTMCSPGPTSCETTFENITRLTLVGNDIFEDIYLDDGEVTTKSDNMNPVEPFTSFSGDWVYFSGSNVGSGEQADGYYIISEVPIPAAAWLFGSALLGLGVLKRRRA